MKIELGVGPDGNAYVSAPGLQRPEDVLLTPLEEQAVSLIYESVKDLPYTLHCERRSSSYLSIVGPRYGDDFCKLKATSKSLWFSLALWSCGVEKDPRLDCVANKNQRHWKIPLSDVSDILQYSDLIRLSEDRVMN